MTGHFRPTTCEEDDRFNGYTKNKDYYVLKSQYLRYKFCTQSMGFLCCLQCPGGNFSFCGSVSYQRLGGFCNSKSGCTLIFKNAI